MGPINVQTTHPEKNQPKNSSKKSDKPSKNVKVPEAPKTTRAETGSELKERLQSRLNEFKSAREPKKAFNPAEQAAREQKKQLKRAQKKAKRARTLEKQKDGQSVPQQRGNQNKTLASENPMRVERKTEQKESNIEFSKFNFVTGNEAAASGGKIAAESEKYSEKKKAKLEGKASHKLLKHAEGLQKRIEFLEKSNPEAAKQLK